MARRSTNKKSNIDAAQGPQYLTSEPSEEDKIKWNQLAAAWGETHFWRPAGVERMEVAPADPIKTFDTRLNPISDHFAGWRFK